MEHKAVSRQLAAELPKASKATQSRAKPSQSRANRPKGCRSRTKPSKSKKKPNWHGECVELVFFRFFSGFFRFVSGLFRVFFRLFFFLPSQLVFFWCFSGFFLVCFLSPRPIGFFPVRLSFSQANLCFFGFSQFWSFWAGFWSALD